MRLRCERTPVVDGRPTAPQEAPCCASSSRFPPFWTYLAWRLDRIGGRTQQIGRLVSALTKGSLAQTARPSIAAEWPPLLSRLLRRQCRCPSPALLRSILLRWRLSCGLNPFRKQKIDRF